ncbi:hypothetical protein MRX96_034364 [Rhipicephalus microplus]
MAERTNTPVAAIAQRQREMRLLSMVLSDRQPNRVRLSRQTQHTSSRCDASAAVLEGNDAGRGPLSVVCLGKAAWRWQPSPSRPRGASSRLHFTYDSLVSLQRWSDLHHKCIHAQYRQ